MANLCRYYKKKREKLQNYICKRILRRPIVDSFHRLYYESEEETWKKTFWLGVETQKCPFDLWVYQEIIFEIKPDVIIETGTYNGGSALFLACLCDLLNRGKIISIDIEEREDRPRHARISYLLGSSTQSETVKRVEELIPGKNQTLVILDSDHNKKHVLEELRIYSRFVTKGSYLIVEDTNINGHPVNSDFGPGPMEAVHEFLKENQNFVMDHTREKLYLSFNPDGYLKRIC